MNVWTHPQAGGLHLSFTPTLRLLNNKVGNLCVCDILFSVRVELTNFLYLSASIIVRAAQVTLVNLDQLCGRQLPSSRALKTHLLLQQSCKSRQQLRTLALSCRALIKGLIQTFIIALLPKLRHLWGPDCHQQTLNILRALKHWNW